MISRTTTIFERSRRGVKGFTLIEVMIAASIMIILSVGTLAVYSHASRINAGNNLRSQAAVGAPTGDRVLQEP